jgi:hypothetical protein
VVLLLNDVFALKRRYTRDLKTKRVILMSAILNVFIEETRELMTGMRGLHTVKNYSKFKFSEVKIKMQPSRFTSLSRSAVLFLNHSEKNTHPLSPETFYILAYNPQSRLCFKSCAARAVK